MDTVQAALKIEKAKLVWAVALNLLKGLFLTYFSQLYELTQLSCTFSASLLGLPSSLTLNTYLHSPAAPSPSSSSQGASTSLLFFSPYNI